MITLLTALAVAAAAQPAQPAPANPHAQHNMTSGQMHQSAMGHSEMAQHGAGCCAKTADGKMECRVMQGNGAAHGSQSQQQGHSGH